MSGVELGERIVARARAYGAGVDAGQGARLAAYLSVLARWNRRLNLTALPVDPPADAAIDRLVVEPVIAAALLGQNQRTLVDVGSGAGSPAIPLKVMCPWVRLVMVEVRERKAAFLRAAVRELELADCTVQVRKFGETTEKTVEGLALTVRAVRLDTSLVSRMIAALGPQSVLIHFGRDSLEGPSLERASVLALPGGSEVSGYAVRSGWAGSGQVR